MLPGLEGGDREASRLSCPPWNTAGPVIASCAEGAVSVFGGLHILPRSCRSPRRGESERRGTVRWRAASSHRPLVTPGVSLLALVGVRRAACTSGLLLALLFPLSALLGDPVNSLAAADRAAPHRRRFPSRIRRRSACALGPSAVCLAALSSRVRGVAAQARSCRSSPLGAAPQVHTVLVLQALRPDSRRRTACAPLLAWIVAAAPLVCAAWRFVAPSLAPRGERAHRWIWALTCASSWLFRR